MAGINEHKKILLYIMRELIQNTDEEHALNAAQLAERLKGYGCDADRRTIYADIQVLTDLGMDIIQNTGNRGGYYLASRDFELPELKLLVDAVQSSKFITAKKSRVLIDKLEKLASSHQARELNREVYLLDRAKAGNESIFYSVDGIHTAINSDRKIAFKYADWTPEKVLRPRYNGEFYRVSPWALTWADENYYLIAFDDREKKIKYYRVDKMLEMSQLEEAREGKEEFGEYDPSSFARKTFGMFGGSDQEVTLRFENSLTGVMIDRFGTDIIIVPDGKDHSRTTVPVTVSRQFYGWVTGIGGDLEIASPDDVKEKYKEYIENILKKY
ncbi:MAG: WYL domain-containing transcriptional regulator [Lachnospiraceae bacterium]|nr:WYL domain-containing transcriptional regulator [Lachnospiraceae bacterium]